MSKERWPRRGNRKTMYKECDPEKAFDYLENQVLEARVRSKFSSVLRSAQREVDYWRLGAFDVDSVIYDYASRKLQALLELKAKSQVDYLNGYFLFRESQYLVTKAIAERLGVPYYWVIWNREGNLWYVTDVLKARVQIVKSSRLKWDAFARLDKDSFLMLTDEEFKDWLIQHVF
ncbi:hypothetical protein [Thermococcus sp.]|uniref:hypothetical protein n=1 Tax=Thermococcus sp. TaxID=35749 RepID=UPI0025CCD5C8|nr:hypothetical protein [Thermococcus sp.]